MSQEVGEDRKESRQLLNCTLYLRNCQPKQEIFLEMRQASSLLSLPETSRQLERGMIFTPGQNSLVRYNFVLQEDESLIKEINLFISDFL